MDSATMTRKKAGKAKGKADGPREDYIRIRMTPEFKEWLGGLADHCQLTMTDTVIQALIRFGKEQGHEPAPKR